MIFYTESDKSNSDVTFETSCGSMAATERQWTVREDGCLFIDKNLRSVTYHSSLNSIVLSSKDQSITVLDATSGIVLKKSDLSGEDSDLIMTVLKAGN